ncbi:MAG TPA: mannitol dehydrogenase family protein [Polaromonas sp.]|uniref:mannitol dehydrogenase family protein n=1 Tax=Polaromonas sp. TaxID=1869339 RepID=UPI002D6A1E0F|nr:mannitol dehydrogenase family protein [Polaromonas sp.]HYW55630.1 mannitol dehydrogenase family protein [Polaromonas sp.]
MTAKLNATAVLTISSPGVAVFDYPRPVQPGVVHLGLGAFHRAHQALVFDGLLQSGDPRWGVLGVAMRSTAVADTLKEQDGLYSVQLSSAGKTRCQIVGSIVQTCVAAREPEQVTAAIAAASTRWITLTVTEKGYTAELAGLLLKGLAQRRVEGHAGLTIASCDNLSGNGDKLKALCLQAAGDEGLRRWISDRCTFPNSMVDRIVPAATPACSAAANAVLGVADEGALATEEFWEWVIEENFADPEDAAVLRGAGVNVVASVKPFEDAKLRMLNGSHSAIACIGAVLGLPTVFDCVAQPEIRAFIHALMTEEIIPGIARPDAPAYRDALLERFANPALNHSVHQIATDSSKKIPQRWVPAAQSQLDCGGSVDRLALAAAAWMNYCRGEEEGGATFALNDPQAANLQALATQYKGNAAQTAGVMLDLPGIWGESLSCDTRWRVRVKHGLSRIQALGLRGALAEINIV